MIEELYAVKDDLSGKFSIFGMFTNDDVAKREFQRFANIDGNPTKDLTLYSIGSFNHDTGCLDGINPIFIDRGVKNNA